MTGSRAYRGAAALSVEGALRSGVGYVYFASEPAVADVLLPRFPEVIYRSFSAENREELSALSESVNATLFGCGSGNTESTKTTVISLLKTEKTPLILDADALNAIASDSHVLATAKRPVVITPHPLEFARLTGKSLSQIEREKVLCAKEFASEHKIIVLLKGYETVITDGERVFLNQTGDSSLAKAGSGDVLAGFLTGLCASGVQPLEAAALAAYLHGKAGKTLGEQLSPYGTTASDLPKAMAKEIRKIVY